MAITFSELKRNYKTLPTQVHRCSMSFPNTCAIRMSEALIAVRPDLLASFKRLVKNLCPHGHVRGAQDLAAALAHKTLLGPRTIGFERPLVMPVRLKAQRGIICFMNIPTYSGQGHIDLWDGLNTVGSNSEYWDASPIWFWRLI